MDNYIFTFFNFNAHYPKDFHITYLLFLILKTHKSIQLLIFSIKTHKYDYRNLKIIIIAICMIETFLL